MIVYCTSPIDDWSGWKTEAQFLKQLLNECCEVEHVRGAINNSPFSSFGFYSKWRDRAFKLARLLEWEDDIRGCVYVAGLPIDGLFIMAWKQDNNGTCFVASPYELPFLESATTVFSQIDEAEIDDDDVDEPTKKPFFDKGTVMPAKHKTACNSDNCKEWILPDEMMLHRTGADGEKQNWHRECWKNRESDNV